MSATISSSDRTPTRIPLVAPSSRTVLGSTRKPAATNSVSIVSASSEALFVKITTAVSAMPTMNRISMKYLGRSLMNAAARRALA